jgi:hypothetical protein
LIQNDWNKEIRDILDMSKNNDVNNTSVLLYMRGQISTVNINIANILRLVKSKNGKLVKNRFPE